MLRFYTKDGQLGPLWHAINLMLVYKGVIFPYFKIFPQNKKCPILFVSLLSTVQMHFPDSYKTHIRLFVLDLHDKKIESPGPTFSSSFVIQWLNETMCQQSAKANRPLVIIHIVIPFVLSFLILRY